MKALDIDFGRSPLAWGRRAGWVALLTGVGICAAVVVRHHDLQVRRQSVLAEQERIESSRKEPRDAEVAGSVTASRMAALADIRHRLGTPWQVLLDEVASSIDPDSALLAIEPDWPQRRVQLLGEARDLPAVLALVRRVEAMPSMEGAQLVEHEVDLVAPQRPVRFSIGARWVPGLEPARAESAAER
jgi:Tfp pilus assembly protein PilN